jgi:HAMP domain-containing protein
MFRTISFKVAFLINTMLLVLMGIGTVLLISLQDRQLNRQFMDEGKFMSLLGAKAVSRVIEEGIDNGVFTLDEAFDAEYVLIPGFDPPKYHTKYDSYLDKALLSLQDEFLKNPNCLFACAVDTKGYLPTHNSKYQQAITGDKEKDKVGNRSKRIFNDPVGLAAARNQQEGFVQNYSRDTGESALDFASPITVKGRHWGNFRVDMLNASILAARKEHMLSLIGLMAAGLMVTTWGALFTIKIALRPLTRLTVIASRMADGNVDEKIVATSKDEIGALADVLERMRISMKAAIERLARKG